MPAPSLLDPNSLARYGRLSLIARHVVEGFFGGIHRSPYKGFSVEFAEHRQYYPGDEIRHIDWRAYAKTDRYYIKEHEEETNLQAYLFIDASGSMAFQASTISKFQYAQYVAASLAYLMLYQRDAVGLVMHDHALRTLLPPRSSSKQLMRILHALETTAPAGETKLAALWDRLAHRLRARSMLLIFSDCFDQIDGLIHALRHLRHRQHEILLFHILAPEEIEFPFSKRTQFRHLESAGLHRSIVPCHVREAYLTNFNAFCQSLRKHAENLQIDYYLMRTDEPVQRALGLYLRKRQARRY